MNRSHGQRTDPATVFLPPDRSLLSWPDLDPERRFGMPAGRDTSPHPFTSLLLSAIFTLIIYGVAWILRQPLGAAGDTIWDLLAGYFGIPIGIITLSMWALAILFLKWRKIAAQRTALGIDLLPPDPEFRLTRDSVDAVVDRLEGQIEEPARLLLIDRLVSVLRNVRNVGRVGDIDEMFASAADADEARMESSYTVIRGFLWAIPVLGFIGTILGLTEAISRFGDVLGNGGEDTSLLTERLGGVIAGLDTAFITTGEGLVAALILQLIMVSVRRSDEILLDDIRKICTTRVLSRVRLTEAETA